MTQGAAKRSTALNEAVMERANPARRESVQSQSAITANPFYQVAFDPNTDPSAKKDAMERLMTSALDSKQDRERAKQFEEFRGFLADQSTELSKQIISLTNVEVMSKLQQVINDMNRDMLSFNDKMTPIMNIIDSIHELNTGGHMTDVFRDIEKDKELEAKRLADLAAKEAEIEAKAEESRRLAEQNVRLGQEKSFFGMGTVRKESRIQQELNAAAIAANDEAIARMRAEAIALREPISTTGDPEMERHKANLRALLDMTDEQNRQRMIDLRDSAIQFIDTSKERTTDLSVQLAGMSDQVARVEDKTHGMQRIYAIMNDALDGASKQNARKREEILSQAEADSALARMAREEKIRALDSHVTDTARIQADTMTTFADLSQQAIKVDTMKATVNDQMETARKISKQGISSTAEGLAVVLTAAAGAALNEATISAQNTLNAMRESTNEIASRQTIAAAMGTVRISETMQQVMTDLGKIAEVRNVANDIQRGGMAEILERMEDLKRGAEEATVALQNSRAMASTMDAPAASRPAAGAADPFSSI